MAVMASGESHLKNTLFVPSYTNCFVTNLKNSCTLVLNHQKSVNHDEINLIIIVGLLFVVVVVVFFF